MAALDAYHVEMNEFVPPAPLRPILSRIDAMARARDLQGYVAGGSVRDALLGRAMRDLDIAIDGDADGFARSLAAALGGHFVVLDEAHAIARVVLDGAFVAYVDVARLQGTLDADLRRRDFTIDALAVPLGKSSVIDRCGGVADLEARVVRMTSAAVFDEDPLRMLRGARLAAELSFELDPRTAAAIRADAPRVIEAAAERRRDEVARIFALDRAAAGVRLLDALELLDLLIPELSAGRGVAQPADFHAYDVFDHNVAAVEAMDVMLAVARPSGDRAWMWEELWRTFAWREDHLRAYLSEQMSEGRERRALLKFAALLHDIAKPLTRTIEADGRMRFFGHADEGASAATRILRRYRFSSREAAFAGRLVEEHLRPVQLAAVGEVPTRRALYRFQRDLGDALEGVLLLALADAAAARGERMTRDGWSRQAAYMNSLLVRLQGEEGIVDAPTLLSGHDIMSEFGLSEGPLIGRLLAELREAQATGGVRGRAASLAFVAAELEGLHAQKDVDNS